MYLPANAGTSDHFQSRDHPRVYLYLSTLEALQHVGSTSRGADRYCVRYIYCSSHTTGGCKPPTEVFENTILCLITNPLL